MIRRRVQSDGSEWLLVDAHDVVRVYRRSDAEALFDEVARSSFGSFDLANLAQSVGAFRSSSSATQREALVTALTDGRLLVVELREEPPVLDEIDIVPLADLAMEPFVEEETWVEVVLIDEDDRPVPDEPYWIRFPDGREVEFRLDAQGIGRHEGLRPGTCHLRFPRLDGEVWRSA